MESQITGKVALVTGASSGIGAAIAKALAKDGAKVAVMARRKEKLEELCAQITEGEGECFVTEADVTDRKQVEESVEMIKNKWGPVDILINNAAVLLPTPMKNLQVDDWLQVVDVNIKGVLHCIGATLEPMVEKGSGHIINISSVGGKVVNSQLMTAAPYCGSKFFIQGFTSGMRQELSPKGIKVCSVCPGAVLTELLQSVNDPEASETMKKLLEQFGGIETCVENECILLAEDIAESVRFVLNQPSRVGVNDLVVEPRAMVNL